jgi:hypothetical protein
MCGGQCGYQGFKMLKQKRYQGLSKLATRCSPAYKQTCADERQSLRRIEDKSAGDWRNALHRMKSLLAQLTFLPGAASHNMCKNYGHIIREFESHSLPRCDECGKKVTNSSEIRGSTLMETRNRAGFDLI